MALLGPLRIVKRSSRMFEIGTGILQVRVEKKLVQAGIVVVMARDVLLRPATGVSLMEAAKGDAGLLQRLDPGQILELSEVSGSELENFVEIAFRDRQAAVHVEFAKIERRIDNELPLRCAIGKPDPQERTGAVAEPMLQPVGRLQLEVAVPHELSEQTYK